MFLCNARNLLLSTSTALLLILHSLSLSTTLDVQGDLQVDDNTVVDGKLSVGTNSPTSYSPSADDLVVKNTGDSGLSIISGSSSASNVLFGDGTSSSAEARGGIQYKHSDDDFYFWSAFTGTAFGGLMILENSGALTFGTGSDPGSSKVGFYNSSGRMKCRDSQGNNNVISPHYFELYQPDAQDPLPWTYHSENRIVGKKINVDMSKAVRLLEELTGQQLVYVEDLPADQLISEAEWKAAYRENKIAEEKLKLLLANPYKEVPLQEALEEIEEETEDTVIQAVTKYRINAQSGELETYTIESMSKIKTNTGRTIKIIRSDCHLNEDTGKCYRKLTTEDIELSQQVLDDINKIELPMYIKNRLR